MDRVKELENEIYRLNAIVDSMDKSARLLVQRDLQLRRANIKLETLDTQKSEFISIAAHQIRTPLSALRWSQQMLLDGDLGELNPRQRDVVSLAQQSTVRLVKLVNNLLEVEHLELQTELKPALPININVLVKESCDEFINKATEHNVRVLVDLAPTPAIVLADASSVKDVLVNIIDNAIKYTLAGGTVTVRVKVVDESVIVTVEDTGIGIPIAHEDKIFKRFSRAENAKKVDADGYGLGLYIVSKIMDSLGGTVRFESREGLGSTFTLTFKHHTGSV
ncbi:MAG: HAMP domain-containing sensor histidine kinase [Patescibacteria group bacterium]